MSEQADAIGWAGLLYIKNRRLLTLKESDKPFYLVPGGKVNPGETDEQAAEREVMEELGVVASNFVHFTTITEASKSTGQIVEFRVYSGEIESEPDTEKLPNKTESIAYINSQYENDGIEIGNLLMHLLPILVERDLID